MSQYLSLQGGGIQDGDPWPTAGPHGVLQAQQGANGPRPHGQAQGRALQVPQDSTWREGGRSGRRGPAAPHSGPSAASSLRPAGRSDPSLPPTFLLHPRGPHVSPALPSPSVQCTRPSQHQLQVPRAMCRADAPDAQGASVPRAWRLPRQKACAALLPGRPWQGPVLSRPRAAFWHPQTTCLKPRPCHARPGLGQGGRRRRKLGPAWGGLGVATWRTGSVAGAWEAGGAGCGLTGAWPPGHLSTVPQEVQPSPAQAGPPL